MSDEGTEEVTESEDDGEGEVAGEDDKKEK